MRKRNRWKERGERAKFSWSRLGTTKNDGKGSQHISREPREKGRGGDRSGRTRTGVQGEPKSKPNRNKKSWEGVIQRMNLKRRVKDAHRGRGAEEAQSLRSVSNKQHRKYEGNRDYIGKFSREKE